LARYSASGLRAPKRPNLNRVKALDKSLNLSRRTYRKTLSSCLWFSKIAWNFQFVSYFLQKIVDVSLYSY